MYHAPGAVLQEDVHTREGVLLYVTSDTIHSAHHDAGVRPIDSLCLLWKLNLSSRNFFAAVVIATLVLWELELAAESEAEAIHTRQPDPHAPQGRKRAPGPCYTTDLDSMYRPAAPLQIVPAYARLCTGPLYKVAT